MSHAVEKIVVFFETLTPESVQRFSQFYTEDAYFKDPFNEVRGIAPIQRIFAHMYTALHEPRFVVTGRIVEGEQVFLLLFGTGLRGHAGLPTVNVKIGGVDAETLFLGPQGGFVGLDQGNIRIPRSLAGRGEVDVVVTVGAKTANIVSVNVR